MNTVSVNERTNLLILSSAFSTLFSTSKADFALSQSHSIKLSDYVKHLLKYKNSWFYWHFCFWYYIFNHIMRDQMLSSVKYIY